MINIFEKLLDEDGMLRYINKIYTSSQMNCLKLQKTVHSLFFMRCFTKTSKIFNNLSNTTEINIPLVQSVYNVLESISYLGRRLWHMFSVECKNIESLLEFENKIKGRKIRIDVVAKFKKKTICNVGYV